MGKYGIQSISNLLLIAIFMLTIYAPPLKILFTQEDKISGNEKRVLASIPALTMKPESFHTFPSKFEAYYNDHFGFRPRLIYLHNYVKAKWLKISPVEIVMLGKNGWLYYEPTAVIEDFQGKIPFTPKQLDRCKHYFEHRRDWLAERGIRYLMVVVPNKHSVYPENIRDQYLNKRGKTRLDQVTQYLDDHSDLTVLDLRGPLLEEKAKGQVYFPTDLHLNAIGAFIAYREIIHKISKWFPEEKVLEKGKLTEFTKYTTDGELAVMLGLPECYPAPRPVIKVRQPCSKKQNLKLDSAQNCMTTTRICESATLHGVVFMDSMCLRIMPFLSENFKRVHYIWRDFNYEVMEEILKKEPQNPDIVIEEMAEPIFVGIFFEKLLENIQPPN